MDSMGSANDFDYTNMNNFLNFRPSSAMDGGAQTSLFPQTHQPAASQMPADHSFLKPVDPSTSCFYPDFLEDEAIDTSNFDMLDTRQQHPSATPQFPQMDTDFFNESSVSDLVMQENLNMETLLGNSAWNNGLSPALLNEDFLSTPGMSFDTSPVQHPFPSFNSNKRPLDCGAQEPPRPKRQVLADFQTASPFLPSPVPTTTPESAWTTDAASSFTEVGLNDDAADICATWFSKYGVLPNDQHIESLANLTGEPAPAIRQWFSQMLKQGMAGHDSAYKSQSTVGQREQSANNTTDSQSSTEGLSHICNSGATQNTTSPVQTGRKKCCKPTSNPDLLSRDPNKIFQCTRKCGKRYGRKCDWKRNEEEGYPSKAWLCSLCRSQGVERVKPCYRRYHFAQHFRNIHPGVNPAEYEADSVVESEADFPKRCGFCPKIFKSRQERIDHIADHFRKGKCMLDWKDDEEDQSPHDSDDGDDDDDSDKPDGGNHFQRNNNASSEPPNRSAHDPSGSGRGGSGAGGSNYSGGFLPTQFGQQHLQSDRGVQESELFDSTDSTGKFTFIHVQPPQTQTEDGTPAADSTGTPAERRQYRRAGQDSIEKAASDDHPSLLPGHDDTTINDIHDIGQDVDHEVVRNLKNFVEGFDKWMAVHKLRFGPSPSTPTSEILCPNASEHDGGIDAGKASTGSRLFSRVDSGVKVDDNGGETDQHGTLQERPSTPSRNLQETQTTHSRPWKCSVQTCTYHEQGWPTEKERDTHVNDKHSSTTSEYRCLHTPCAYVSKRESNCQQHMEKAHGWEYIRSKNTGRRNAAVGDSSTLPTPLTPSLGTSMSSSLATSMTPFIPSPPYFVSTDLTAVHENGASMPATYRSRFGCEVAAVPQSTSFKTPPSPPSFAPAISATVASSLVDTLKSTVSLFLHTADKSLTRSIRKEARHGSRAKSEGFGDALAKVKAMGSLDMMFEHGEASDLARKVSHILDTIAAITVSSPKEGAALKGGRPVPTISKLNSDSGRTDVHFKTILQTLDNALSSTDKSIVGRLLDRIYQITTSMLLTSPEEFMTPMYRAAYTTRTAPESMNLQFEISSKLCTTLGELSSTSFSSVKLLGTGGFSTVDEVIHRRTNLRISRKTLKNREQSAIEELQREVRVLQKLRHPHIIRLLGSYTRGDKVSILLSPVAETTLSAWLEKATTENTPGLAEKVLKMYGCLASSVRYLHEQRPVIKHLDIKPQNILVMEGDYSFPHVVLSDFGISQMSDETDDTAGSQRLTRQYCAPEVASTTSRSAKADIWSLGCVFLEMAIHVLSRKDPQYIDFRQEFCGCEGKCYWQNLTRLHGWLTHLRSQATPKESAVLSTVKAMLSGDPNERPDATTLTIIFTPAPCCLSWPAEVGSFPGPKEESHKVEMFRDVEDVDCLCHPTSVEKLSSMESNLAEQYSPRAWLHECRSTHEFCAQKSLADTNAKAVPTRLLEILDADLSGMSVRLVTTASFAAPLDYAALSFTWADSMAKLTTENMPELLEGISASQLHKQVVDGLRACVNLGLRYLWVDSLCVIQDSKEDRKKECNLMASVFRNALLTIVVFDNDASASTTLSRSPSPSTSANMVDASASAVLTWCSRGFAWDTRAWSLQERLLSPRLLHLTEGQMYWECCSLKASETFPRGLPPLIWEKVHSCSTHVHPTGTSTRANGGKVAQTGTLINSPDGPVPASNDELCTPATECLTLDTCSLAESGQKGHNYPAHSHSHFFDDGLPSFDFSIPIECTKPGHVRGANVRSRRRDIAKTQKQSKIRKLEVKKDGGSSSLPRDVSGLSENGQGAGEDIGGGMMDVDGNDGGACFQADGRAME